MDDIGTILDGLDSRRQDYVWERSRLDKDSDAFRAAGIPRSAFYAWEDREELNKLADKLRANRKIQAELALLNSVAEAAAIKVDGLKSKNQYVRQGAASEILDRILGKPTQRQEHSGEINFNVDTSTVIGKLLPELARSGTQATDSET